LLAAAAGTGLLLVLLARRRRRGAGEERAAAVALHREDAFDRQMRRLSWASRAEELSIGGVGTSHQVEGHVRAHNVSVFYALVPAGSQLSLSVYDVLGSALALYWRSGLAPVPCEGAYDGRCGDASRLSFVWQAPGGDAPTALYVALANTSHLVARYSLRAALLVRTPNAGSVPAPTLVPRTSCAPPLPPSLGAAGRRVVLLQRFCNELQLRRAERWLNPTLRISGNEPDTVRPK